MEENKNEIAQVHDVISFLLDQKRHLLTHILLRMALVVQV